MACVALEWGAKKPCQALWLGVLLLLHMTVEAQEQREKTDTGSPGLPATIGAGRSLTAAPPISPQLVDFLERWHIEDMPEVDKDDGRNRDRFFTANFQQSAEEFAAAEAARKQPGRPGGGTRPHARAQSEQAAELQPDATADTQSRAEEAAGEGEEQQEAAQQGTEAKPKASQSWEAAEAVGGAEELEAPRQRLRARQKPRQKRKPEPVAAALREPNDLGTAEDRLPIGLEEAAAAEKAAAGAVKGRRAGAGKKRRAEKPRSGGNGGGNSAVQRPAGDGDPLDGCRVFVMDLAPLASREGLPACDLARLAAQPLTQRLLPDPRAADPGAAAELDAPPEALAWQYPYTAWPHNYSQHAAPWFVQQEVLRRGMQTANISEADVVLVDDYCYFSWAIADLRAKGHWWLDTHKHYTSDFKVGAHLLDLYHAMVHEDSFIHKQGRNYLFMAPLTTYDFGDWKALDDYTAMSCEHFSNSMHVVFDQVQRWRCGRYRPSRTLVAPLSVADATAEPPQDAERPLTLTFRGSCTPDGGKEPAYAGKRLRAQLVRLLADSGDDVSLSCTNEDKTGMGPAAVESHAILTHVDYMRELGRSKFCAIIPGETQNTPRITEAFLAGCVPVFIGPPWHAMPFPDVVDWRAAAVAVHMSDTSRWANFGAKWALEKNAPRDVGRTHPRWWTPQVSVRDMEEMHSLTDLVEILRDYPEEQYQAKRAAVHKFRPFFQWAAEGGQPGRAAEHTLRTVCEWGREERKVAHIDI